MPQATTSALGEIKLAGDLAGVNDALAPELSATGVTPGTYVLPTIAVDAKGRLTSATNGDAATLTSLLPNASTTVKGLASVSPTGNISIAAGVISISTATNSVKGIASFSPQFTVTSGAVSLNPSNIVPASGSVFGLVKTGSNVTNTAGVISIPDASTSVKGVASFNATDFSVLAGVVSLNLASLPVATGSTAGVVKTGSGITNTAGTLTIDTATGSTLGVVKTGTNITNTAGVISIPDATTSVKGIASFNSADFTVTAGAVSLNSSSYALTSVQNTWTKAQSYASVPLTYAATITPDFSLSNVFSLTATGNFTLANPTNVVAGTTYLIIVTQDATGGRTITWGSNFKFGTNAQQTLSTVAAKRDIISVVAVSPTVLLVTLQVGF